MNILEMMQKAQKFKAEMEESQKKLAMTEVVGCSGGDMVKVTMSCDYKVIRVEIDDSISDDNSLLEDLTKLAFNDALQKISDVQKNNMSDQLKGLGLPPDFKMPF